MKGNKTMMGREKTAAGIGAALTIGLTGYSAWQLLGKGLLSWHISQPETGWMMAEFAVVWLFLFMSVRKSRLLMAVLLPVFFWLHQIFLPVGLSAIYVGYLILAGMWFARTFLRKELDVCWNFMIGSGITVAVFCLLSLIQMGSIWKLRMWVAGSGCVLAVWGWRLFWRKRKLFQKPEEDHGLVYGLMVSAVFALLLLQAGRMNAAVDFDSIWYGVRSDVMLDSGNGIYENLGTLGVVYTYSKGFETLCLPLAGLPSYSFLIVMNVWMTAMTLMASYKTALVVLNRKQAVWAPFLMAALPGIMNMANTAKADLMTVFCQILMVQAMIRFIQEKRGDWLVAGMAAGGLSLTLKPTAVVYSPAIVGMSFLWICFYVLRDPKKRNMLTVKNKRIWRMLCPSALALIGIWGRTVYLVGVPVTSVFYGLFQKLGFQVRYPFYASGFPAAGKGQTWREGLQFLAKRLYGLLVNPQGEDMAHVIIAWGTVMPLVMFLLWLFMREGRRKGREQTELSPLSFLAWLLIPLFVVNLISLYSLSQIDGNYYMLYYALAVIACVIWMHRIPEEKCRRIKILLLPAWCYAATLCFVTNWAWALGNGGLHPVNQGYYSHQEEAHRKRAEQGSSAIWDILASNPKNRVIALGEHPGVLTFPCWVQSYVDVSGYWGNPEVVADAPNFLAYLQFADVDYIYMEKEYVDTSVRIYQIIRSLVETGWLDDVRDENGNLIMTVKKEQDVTAEAAEKNLQVFDERYIQHP